MSARTSVHTPVPKLRSFVNRNVRLISHLGFWIAALAFYTVYFGQRQSSYGQSLIFVGLLFPITIATTYFLLYWLIPRYLLKRRYVQFGLYFTYTLVFSVYLELMLVTIMFVTVANFRELFIPPTVTEFLNVLVGIYVVVFAGVALHLLKRWYDVRESNLELDRMRLEAELKLKEAELKLLKSQIHPHFLFNTLNSLYGLTLERSESAADVVLRISSMLDYMLYRGPQRLVPLEEEVEYINNYLALEKLRFGDRVRVDFAVDRPAKGHLIAPLLLIPFVENSFKHGTGQANRNGEIHIRLSVTDSRLAFVVENSKPAARAPSNRDAEEGIGLKNVQKRLDLLYAGRHELEIQDGEQQFRIELQVELDEPEEDAVPDR